ncbi:hypothetical protein [Rufibacter quisquiliarum]|uniref:Putative phage terminase large subunit-like protein n=1 Tax=Rufibacter quisquiliarum TaxID=1549639 RepID=A0A839GM83_9BACT|nr:hypothetical protein [Rufibacter quisquiliarum]MBA9076086.1 putative phage terminase large subunit-like protein [Rufibacter quisquiliarum]
MDELKGERCKRRFYFFFLEFWETIEAVELVPNWHIEAVCDELQEVYEIWKRGESQPDMLINIPPGSSKSTMVTQLFPAWLWVNEPSIRVISNSYSSTLSVGHAVKTRDCLKSDKFQRYYPGLIEFKHDSDGKSAFKNTRKGERFTTSTGGTVTGVHGDFIIDDDPLNPEMAESEVERNTANRHASRTLSTRKTNRNRTVTIRVMQRLHEDDPAGRMLKKKRKPRHICLPGELTPNAVVKPERLREKYVDGLLDANRLDREALAILAEDLGSYGYAGQVQQSPSPEGGGQLKKSWFKKITWPEFLEKTKGMQLDWQFDADTAFTEDQKNDPSAFMSSVYIPPLLYIRNVAEEWLEFPQLKKRLPEFCLQNGYGPRSKVHVEPKATGKPIVQELRSIRELNFVEAPNPEKSKRVRVNGIAPFCEAGRVVLIDGAWNDMFLDQCAGFPMATHDDMVDDLVQAVNRANGKKKSFGYA